MRDRNESTPAGAVFSFQNAPCPPLLSLLLIGPLHPSAGLGLAVDIAVARALGHAPLPICTALVAAGGGRVTDVLEVPSDSVRAQLEHAMATSTVDGVRVGALASARAVEVVFAALEGLDVPVVLDFVASGSSGETLLDARGIDLLIERMARADVVLFSRRDAELVGGGAIESLDDAQVALQRIHRRGARGVLIRCGRLATRFYDATQDPGGDGAAGAMESDLYFDGVEFTLLEAPHVPAGRTDGAASLFSVCITASLAAGEPMEDALRQAKGYVTEAIRRGTDRAGVRELALDWQREPA